jgi:hypothetical protein
MSDDWTVRVRAWPAGPDARRAADLAIAAGWLDDPRFVEACVVPVGGDGGMAVIDWAALAAHARDCEAAEPERSAELRAVHAVAARGWEDRGRPTEDRT